MFIASDNELREFTSRLLEHNYSSEVIKTLGEEDQKRLRYVKISMQERMPQELHSVKYKTIDWQKVTYSEKESFPRMFDVADKKTYQYIDDDLQNIRKIASTYGEFSKSHISKLDPNQPLEKQEQAIVSLEEKEGASAKLDEDLKEIEKNQEPNHVEVKPAHQERSKKSRPQSQQLSKHSFMSSAQKNPFAAESPKVNPFINNKLNFTDQYANSKTLQDKYPHVTLSQNSRNIAAIVQSSKLDAFSNTGSFPTSVMPGVILAPRESTFSKDAQLDVADVMRYTLGVTKSSQMKSKIQNPFHRPPKKKNE